MLIPERICTLSLVSTAAGVFRTTVSDIQFFHTVGNPFLGGIQFEHSRPCARVSDVQGSSSKR
jgi:hypothetical protein